MLGITDLKKGTLIELNGDPYKVLEYNQKQMGRGGSIVNTRLKNLVGGETVNRTFKGSEKITPADVLTRNVQFLYEADSRLHFMDSQDYSQFAVDESDVTGAELLNEGMECQAKFFDSNPISVELPIKIELEVVKAPEVVKGDTQSTVQKDVTLESGAVIKAPMFIKTGDSIVVDTRDSSYVERVK